MHSYNGSSDTTKALLKLHANFYFSLSLGVIKVNFIK
jgi:Tat protein secretion system quality control protein TatD with DNase activity